MPAPYLGHLYKSLTNRCLNARNSMPSFGSTVFESSVSDCKLCESSDTSSFLCGT